MKSLAERTVGDVVAERLDRARVMEKFGIDYCCGGHRTLSEACRARNLPLAEVERALTAAGEPSDDRTDWLHAPLAELIDNIVNGHHAYLRSELPRLGALLDKVVERHGDPRPSLRDLQRTFVGLWEELFNHMLKEELVLFPRVRRLEEASRGGGPGPHFHCGSVLQPIHMMEEEHRSAGQALEQIRGLTDDYRLPAEACNSWLALWHGLEQLETDLHLHIHKENNILFPQAAELESSLKREAAPC